MAKLRQNLRLLLSLQLLRNVVGWTNTFTNSGAIQSPINSDPLFDVANQSWRKVKLEFLDYTLDERQTVRYVYEGVQPNKTYSNYTLTGRLSAPYLECNQAAFSQSTGDDEAVRRFVKRFSPYGPRMLSGYTKTFKLHYSGNISTPCYPNQYPNNARVTWLLNAGRKKAVQLQITDFQLKSASDVLFIYEGNRSSRKLHSRFTGITKPSVIFLRSNEAVLTFISDSSGASSGFKIKFKSYVLPKYEVQNTHGDYTVAYRLTSPAALRTPNYPHPYDNNVTISWHLSAGPSEKVQLQFIDFQLANGQDNLFIYEGHQLKKVHSRYTSYSYDQKIYLNSSKAVLVFQSDSSTASQGFNIIFSSYKPLAATKATTNFTPGKYLRLL